MPTSILIIEDESPIADVLAYALRSEGYAAQCCTLGREGLEQLRSGVHALAILDVGLPDMSGFEVCREARKFTDIPILFLTARSDEVDRIVGLEIGADDYVTKPFSPREVLMDAIWRDALDTSDRTVDTHIKTLRAKLKAVRDDLDPIVTHRGMGYSVANGAGQ